MTMFQRKFENNVKNEFMRDERKINDLKILMKTAIDFDDRLYERTIKRKYSKRYSKKIRKLHQQLNIQKQNEVDTQQS